MQLAIPLICLSSGLLVPLCHLAFAGEVQSPPKSKVQTLEGPRLVLAMQSAPTVAPALPTPPPEPDCAALAAGGTTQGQPLSTAQTLTAPPAVSLSRTLTQWGRAERRAERRQSQFHPLRRILSAPGRVILAPYSHPVAKDTAN